MNISNYKKNNNRPVGFFDSGVGGLSVYARFKKVMPSENTLYYGDLAHLPYGNKSQKELIGYAREILNFYKRKDVKAVVIACNTSSAQAYETIKDEYEFKIYPIIQSCAKVIASQNINRIGVFATEATVNSGVYTRELKKYNQGLNVYELACPNWVPFVEKGDYTSKFALGDIRDKVEQVLKYSPDKIILGCTHYPYLMPQLTQFAPKKLFIDPAEIFVDYIKNDLQKSELINSSEKAGSEKIFVSANAENFIQHSKIFYNVEQMPELAVSQL